VPTSETLSPAPLRGRDRQDRSSRQIEGERILHHDELAALHRLLLQPFGDVVDLIRRADRANDVLHRKPPVPGSDAD